MKLFETHIHHFIPRLRQSSRDDFAWRLFARNNLILVLLCAFLSIEQLFYAFFISAPGTLLQLCYFVSSALVSCFFVTSFYWQFNKPLRLRLYHRSLPACLVLLGMLVALIRFTFVEFDPIAFRVPVFYVAVLYACAVLFVISPWINFALYSLLSMTAIAIMTFAHPEIVGSFYIADICSNGMVAFMVAVLNYRAFIKNFTASKAIEEKNAALEQKNLEIKRINDKLKIQSEQDELTQLYNRRKVNQILRHLEQRFLDIGETFSIILLDIDYFKIINDSYGHAAGDRVLQMIAQILRDHVRDVDTCGRWGGEEFIIVCPAVNCREATVLADRLRQLISSSIKRNERVTASFGVACYSQNASLSQLLQTGDACLYTAKRKGRNRVATDCADEQYELTNPL